MPMLRYQELNLLQMLDELRGASLAHLALSDGAQPYLVPMAYQLEVRGSEVLLAGGVGAGGVPPMEEHKDSVWLRWRGDMPWLKR